MHLYPVRALDHYSSRMEQCRSECSELLVSRRLQKECIPKNTVSFPGFMVLSLRYIEPEMGVIAG